MKKLFEDMQFLNEGPMQEKEAMEAALSQARMIKSRLERVNWTVRSLGPARSAANQLINELENIIDDLLGEGTVPDPAKAVLVQADRMGRRGMKYEDVVAELKRAFGGPFVDHFTEEIKQTYVKAFSAWEKYG